MEVELQGGLLGRAGCPLPPLPGALGCSSLPRSVCSMGTTRAPPHRAAVQMTRGLGESASRGSCFGWFCYCLLRSCWSRPLRNQLAAGSGREQGVRNSAGPRMLPSGLRLEPYPWVPGAAQGGSFGQFHPHPHPVVRASVRAPYLPKLLAGLPMPPGPGVRGDAGGAGSTGLGSCGSAGHFTSRGERGCEESSKEDLRRAGRTSGSAC